MTDITPEQLSAYLDDALAPAERAVVDRALTESPALRHELEALRQTQAWVRELPAPGVPTGFEQRVLRTIQKPRPRTHWWVVAPSVFGAAATALLMILVLRQDRPSLTDKTYKGALPESSSLTTEATPLTAAEPRGRAEKAKDASPDDRPRPLFEDQTASADALPRDTRAQRIAPVVSVPLPAGPAAELRLKQTPGGRAAQEKEWAGGFIGGVEADSLGVSKSRRESAPGLKKAAAPSVLDWRGADSGVTEFHEVVVRSEEEWRALWKEHTAHRVPPPPAPPVDFATAQVVGVFLGQRPSGGYAVEILSVTDGGPERRVAYRETRPRADTLQITVLTQPYHLRVVPRRDAPVRFEKK